MNKFKAAVFDIDGTLTDQVSWTSITKALGESPKMILTIYDNYKKGIISYEKAKEKVLTLWNKSGKANKRFFINLFQEWPLRDGAKEIIDYLKIKNYTICLITGSVDLYAQTIANRLGVKTYYANTELIWDKNNNLIDLNYFLDQRKLKKEHFIHFSKTSQIAPTECIVIGDDDNDMDIFNESGYGIAIQSPTSHKLETVAWKKIKNLLEIKNFV